MDVLVPYGQGMELIADLGTERALWDLDYTKTRLENAKLFSVSVFHYQRRQLEALGALYSVGTSGILALQPTHYHEHTGVSLDPLPLPFYGGV